MSNFSNVRPKIVVPRKRPELEVTEDGAPGDPTEEEKEGTNGKSEEEEKEVIVCNLILNACMYMRN
jgi:hypothetical protein